MHVEWAYSPVPLSAGGHSGGMRSQLFEVAVQPGFNACSLIAVDESLANRTVDQRGDLLVGTPRTLQTAARKRFTNLTDRGPDGGSGSLVAHAVAFSLAHSFFGLAGIGQRYLRERELSCLLSSRIACSATAPSHAPCFDCTSSGS